MIFSFSSFSGRKLIHSFIFICFLPVALLFLSVAVCHGISLTVTVEGIEGELHDNVMAGLRIYRLKDEDDITHRQIHRLHRLAPGNIKKALAPFGYYQVVVDASLSPPDTGDDVKALYRVDAGEPVLVDRLSVEIIGHGAENRGYIFKNVVQNFPLQPGEQLNHILYEQGKQQLLMLAMKHGYMRPEFTEHKVLVRRDEKRADIRLVLDTGVLYHFGKTTVNQGIITDQLFQRFVPYSEGDIFCQDLLHKLQADLYASGYFNRVMVVPDYTRVSNGKVPITVTLSPALPNRYSIGLGYGTDTGIRGNLRWNNLRLNRHGHKVSFFAQYSETGRSIDGDYEIPIFDPRYESFRIHGQYLDESWEDTISELLSLGVSYNHHTDRFQYGTGFEYRNENYQIGVREGTAELFMPGLYGLLVFAEDRIHVEDGIRISGSVRGASRSLLSSTDFIQVKTEGKIIMSPFAKWRIIGRGHLGVTAMESIDELPPSLRFYAGGDKSVRGYGYKELGPTDPSGKVIGGQYLVEATLEIERSLSETWSMAVFYDVGNALDNIDALNDDLKHGAGVGVRLNLPFGKARLDLASGLSEDGYPLRVHISIGADL